MAVCDAKKAEATKPGLPNPVEGIDQGPGRAAQVTSVLGISLLCVLLGSAMADFRLPVYEQVLAPLFRATRSIQYKLASDKRLMSTDLWYPSRYEQRGAVLHDRANSFEGLTLYSSGHDPAAFLIDMQGNVRHEWRLGFYEAWPQPQHVATAVHDRYIFWRKTHLFPNGDLLAIYEGIGDTPYGYGMVKVDRASKVLWTYTDNAHHDFCIDKDGTILLLTHAVRDTDDRPVDLASHLCDRILEDFVVRLSPDGKLLQKVSIVDAFQNSEYRTIFSSFTSDQWDLLHTNAVEVITPEFASHHEFLKPGQVMISMRTCQALAVLDMDQQRIVWVQFGPYRAQHDPDVLDNGNVLLFDNQGNAGPGGPSRVIELDPTTNQIHWQYGGNDENFFYSKIRSGQQRLPNGNLLITESCAGRVLEVTRGGQLVWEFRNPARLEADDRYIAVICAAARIETDQVAFLAEDKRNAETLEVKPLMSTARP